MKFQLGPHPVFLIDSYTCNALWFPTPHLILRNTRQQFPVTEEKCCSDMDLLHVYGVKLIVQLQNTFADWSDELLLVSTIGDPRHAFLLVFPLVYHISPAVGARVLWIASLSEWLNGALKWLQYGERPFWWIHETTLYSVDTRPTLQQYRLTCETGPGSPSGHMMVSTAVLTTLFLAATKCQMSCRLKTFVTVASVTFLLFVGVSRCFIATHFPHQVLLGSTVGAAIAVVFDRVDTTRLSLKHYTVISAALFFSAMAIYWTLLFVGVDPLWSVSLSLRHCLHSDWVHLDTTLLYSFVRDASTVLGLGLGLRVLSTFRQLPVNKAASPSTILQRLPVALFAVAVAQFSEFIPIPKLFSEVAFYSFAAVKNVFGVFLVVVCELLLAAFGLSVGSIAEHSAFHNGCSHTSKIR